MKYCALLWVLFILASGVACAADAMPVEITAKKALEWNRKDKTYVAQGDVIAVQGDTQLTCETLVAHYNESDNSIATLEASDSVTVKAGPYTAFGDHAFYDTVIGRATLTGKDLRVTTDTDTMTARDKIEFFINENRLSATGGVSVKRANGDVMTAQAMDAHFIRSPEGKTEASKVVAKGGVTLKTARATATGDDGVYDVASGFATLNGNVMIKQENGWLQGTKARVNLKTGVSQLLASDTATGGGRVKGVFYPPKKKEGGAP